MIRSRKICILIAVVIPLLMLSACEMSLRIPYSTEEPSPNLVYIDKPVTIIEDPIPEQMLVCSVTEGLPDINGWVKLEDDIHQYANIFIQDDIGRMWIATDGHGVVMFDGESWHRWDSETREDMNAYDDAIRSMAVTSEKVFAGVYGSSSGGNLQIYDIAKDQWQSIAPQTNLLLVNVLNYQWYGVAMGTSKVDVSLQDGEWSAMPIDESYLLIDTDEGRWRTLPSDSNVTTFSVDHSTWKNLPPDTDLLAFNVQRNLWQSYTTEGGTVAVDVGEYSWKDISEDWGMVLFDIENSRYTTISTETILSNYVVRALSGDGWQQVTADLDTISGNIVGGVAVSPLGELYVMTWNGLEIWRNNEWQQYNDPFQNSHYAHSIENPRFDSEGDYWIKSHEGVFQFDGENWHRYSKRGGNLPSDEVTSIEFDVTGRLWVGTREHGISVINDGKYFVFSPENYPWLSGWITGLTFDNQNRLWVTTRDYISVFNGKEVILFTHDAADVAGWGEPITVDDEGCVWATSFRGLIIFQGELDMAPGDFSFLDN